MYIFRKIVKIDSDVIMFKYVKVLQKFENCQFGRSW